MKKYIILLLFSVFIVGCTHQIGERFYTYRDAEPVPPNQLRTDGYYYRMQDSLPDPVIQPIVLWSDGTAARFPGHGTLLSYDEAASLSEEERLERAHHVFQETLATMGRSRKTVPTWGAFRVRSDSITIQYICRYWSLPRVYSTCKEKGVRANDSTFVIKKWVSYPPRGWLLF